MPRRPTSCACLRGLVAERRAHPGDPEADVLTRLIQGDGSGEHFSEPELLHNCIFLLNAGHETTSNLIGNGMHALMTHRDQLERLVADPALMPTAVEELLRFESPLQLNNRLTTAPMAHRRRRHPGRQLPDAGHRRGQPRPGRVRRPRPAGPGAQAEPAPGLRPRRACLRRHERGAAGGAHRDRRAAGALPEDRPGRAAAARPPRCASAASARCRCGWADALLADLADLAAGELGVVVLQQRLDLGHQHVQPDDVGDAHREDHRVGEVDHRAQAHRRADDDEDAEDELEDQFARAALAEQVGPRLQAVVRPRDHGREGEQHRGDGQHVAEEREVGLEGLGRQRDAGDAAVGHPGRR